MTPEQEKEAIALELELRQRANVKAATRKAPKVEEPEPFFDIVGMLKKSYPSTTEAVKEYLSSAPQSPVKGGQDQAAMAKLGMAVMGDIAGYGSRVVGALTGTSKYGDPEGGWLKPERMQLKEHFKKELAANLKRNIPTLAKLANAGAFHIEDAISNFVISLAEDPSFLKGGADATVRALQEAVPGAKSVALQLGALTTSKEAVERAATEKGMRELKAGAKQGAEGGADTMAKQVKSEIDALVEKRSKELDDEFVGLTDTHPIRAFHGTDKDFVKFDPQMSMDDAGAGVFFTSTPSMAGEAADRSAGMSWTQGNDVRNSGQNIRPVKIKEPDMVIDFKDPKDLAKIREEYGSELLDNLEEDGPELMQEIIRHNKNKNIIHFKNASDFLSQADITFVRRPDEVVKPLYGSRTGGRTNADVRGAQLSGAVDATQAEKMKKFGTEEERTLGQIADEPLPMHEATMTEPARSKASDLQKQILADINYKPGADVTGYYSGRVFKKEDTDLLIRLTDDLKEVKDVKEFIAKRRGIDELISYDKDFESRDFLLKGLRTRMNNVIEESFYSTIKDPAKAKTMADAWRANNKFYAEMSESLSGLSRGLNKSEDYVKTLDRLGHDKIVEISNMAEKHSELKPVVEQIKAGYVDDFLLRATDENGRINFQRAKKVWGNLQESQKLMDVVLTKPQQNQIKFALDKFENTEVPGQYLGRHEKAISDKLSAVAHEDKRYAAKELEFLDAIHGRTGKDALSYQAKAMSQAEQLGMSKEGALPVIGKQVLSRQIGSLGSQVRSPWGVVHATKALNKLAEVKTNNVDTFLGIGAGSAATKTAAQDVSAALKEPPKKPEPIPGMGDVKANEHYPTPPPPVGGPVKGGFAADTVVTPKPPGSRRVITPVAGGYEEVPIPDEGGVIPREGPQVARHYSDISPSISERLSAEQRTALNEKLKLMPEKDKASFMQELENRLNKEAGAN